MSSNKSLSLESLKVEINALAEQVQRQNKVVADTGRRLISIEIDKERKSIDSLPTISLPEELISTVPSSKPKSVSFSKEENNNLELDGDGEGNAYIRGDDIVELVTELQGQLDLLEARSIRRTANAFLTKDTDIIAPLPGTDGSIPGEHFTPNDIQEDQDEETALPFLKIPFPKTLKEFRELSRADVEVWCKFYELLPPDEAEIAELLSHAGTTLESLELSLASSTLSNLSDNSTKGLKGTESLPEAQNDENEKSTKKAAEQNENQDSHENHQHGGVCGSNERCEYSGNDKNSKSVEQPGNNKCGLSQKLGGSAESDLNLIEGDSASASLPTEEESNTHFDELARFLGIRMRRTKNVW